VMFLSRSFMAWDVCHKYVLMQFEFRICKIEL